ncbi:MAG: hypothetical protein ACXV5Q_17180, partial [Frankiaceae bacterium]
GIIRRLAPPTLCPTLHHAGTGGIIGHSRSFPDQRAVSPLDPLAAVDRSRSLRAPRAARRTNSTTASGLGLAFLTVGLIVQFAAASHSVTF